MAENLAISPRLSKKFSAMAISETEEGMVHIDCRALKGERCIQLEDGPVIVDGRPKEGLISHPQSDLGIVFPTQERVVVELPETTEDKGCARCERVRG